jgi:hypothetical protein
MKQNIVMEAKQSEKIEVKQGEKIGPLFSFANAKTKQKLSRFTSFCFEAEKMLCETCAP